jgi:glycosyltransferase involved in cell wall biosynthesis
VSLDILIPHYQDLDGLAQALDSIGKQTWTGDYRVIIVDDGSPEEQFHALKRLVSERSLPCVVERNPENRGRPYTRNRLLDSGDSEYVAWLDAGDDWYPEKLARQFEHINRLRFAGEDISRIWVTCDYDWQREGARTYRVEQQVDGDQFKELLLGERLRAYLWTIVGPTSTFRAVGRFDEQLPRLQDLDYFIRFVRAGGIITSVPYRKPLCRYHKSDLGRCAREIRDCNQRIFEKNRTSVERYGRKFRATVKINAERLSARYAKHNGDTWSRLYFISRAFVAHPRYAFGLSRRWAAQLWR